MTTTTVAGGTTAGRDTSQRILSRARYYFASDSRRAFQTVLGLIWLLDGALQFQPFMYSKGFIQMLTATAAGQLHWLASSINWAGHLAQSNLTVFNTLFALIQVAIGLGAAVPANGQTGAGCVVRVGTGRMVVQRGVRDAVRRG